jgi:DNA-binding transcriptional MocR family regulator
MFLWLELPDHLDATALLQQALHQDIAFVPGAAFHSDGSGHNTMRLSFSLSDEAQIEVGIFKLCGLIGQQGMARAVSVS